MYPHLEQENPITSPRNRSALIKELQTLIAEVASDDTNLSELTAPETEKIHNIFLTHLQALAFENPMPLNLIAELSATLEQKAYADLTRTGLAGNHGPELAEQIRVDVLLPRHQTKLALAQNFLTVLNNDQSPIFAGEEQTELTIITTLKAKIADQTASRPLSEQEAAILASLEQIDTDLQQNAANVAELQAEEKIIIATINDYRQRIIELTTDLDQNRQERSNLLQAQRAIAKGKTPLRKNLTAIQAQINEEESQIAAAQTELTQREELLAAGRKAATYLEKQITDFIAATRGQISDASLAATVLAEAAAPLSAPPLIPANKEQSETTAAEKDPLTLIEEKLKNEASTATPKALMDAIIELKANDTLEYTLLELLTREPQEYRLTEILLAFYQQVDTLRQERSLTEQQAQEIERCAFYLSSEAPRHGLKSFVEELQKTAAYHRRPPQGETNLFRQFFQTWIKELNVRYSHNYHEGQELLQGKRAIFFSGNCAGYTPGYLAFFQSLGMEVKLTDNSNSLIPANYDLAIIAPQGLKGNKTMAFRKFAKNHNLPVFTIPADLNNDKLLTDRLIGWISKTGTENQGQESSESNRD